MALTFELLVRERMQRLELKTYARMEADPLSDIRRELFGSDYVEAAFDVEETDAQDSQDFD